MNATIVETITLKSPKITMDLPAAFKGRKVQVVVKDLSEDDSASAIPTLEKLFKKHRLHLPKGYKFDREEIHER